jgi:hypothetical protein
VTEEQLLAAIESQIGKVEAYFKYETDSHKAKKLDSKKKIRKVHTYSIMMEKIEAREALIEAGILKITPDVSVPVEKYEVLKKQSRQKNSPDSKNLTDELSFQSPEMGGVDDQPPNDELFSRSRFQSTQTRTSPIIDSVERLIILKACGHSSQKSLETAYYEYIKPTKKNYHCSHQITPSIALGEDPNLRFNARGSFSLETN